MAEAVGGGEEGEEWDMGGRGAGAGEWGRGLQKGHT